jgi:hypothetical protein
VLQTCGVTQDTLTSFWDRLEEASQDVGLPCGLSDIGRELDLWPSAVQKWRDGVSFPSRKNMITLAENRRVNLEWLWHGGAPKLSENEMDASTREFLKIWNSLPSDAQRRLLDAARYEKNVSTTPPEAPEGPPRSVSPPGFRPRVVPKGPANR